MEKQKFYVCKHCGNMIGFIKHSGVEIVCCGERMTKLEPGKVEASVEKHLPVAIYEDGVVKVEVGL